MDSPDDSTLDSQSAMSTQAADLRLQFTVLWHSDQSRVGQQAVLDAAAADERGLSRTHPVFGDGLPLQDRGASRTPIHFIRTARGLRVVGGRADLPFTLDGEARAQHQLDDAALQNGVTVALGGKGPLVFVSAPAPDPPADPLGMVGPSVAMAQVRRQVERLGPLPFPVLIRGSTGTGKELVAQALHQVSGRTGRLVAINVAALPASTATSQLFGHARGAFTGAARATGGYFGDAEGGTRFLDEVGASSPELQAQLLRALESGEVQPVGGRPRKADVRILAATDEDLDAAIAAGRFRGPLFHRLAHGRIHLPPLRTRPPDIAAQFVYFVGRTAQELHGRSLPHGWLAREDMQALLAHDWSGNTRELRSVAEQCAALSGDLPRCRLPPRGEVSGHAAPPSRSAGPAPLELAAVLADHHYQLEATAVAMGVSRNTLKRRMAALGLPRAVDLSAEDIRAALSAEGNVEGAARTLRVSTRALTLRMNALGVSS